ncbi:arginine decarboxylase [Hydrocarboniphaga daqingensis]|jgi:arginine decarboxylase|uniref:Arginine decarboxylase n=1 Tax=Hydrocarboniphaga daqingensis TaxID=490188 RepID=A0A1M5LKL0_9GAMM|nr:biosynthetic arginine decarboxylase [Hydrocarboniphaga daqingensis]SHG65674.1 arginine decarboxylase [Hydrocarboniphaga daqingensis]
MPKPVWSAARARERYNLPQWGEGYFDVAESGPSAGHVLVRPFRDAEGPAIDLYEIARRLPLEGLDLPVLVRFNNILEDRIDALTGAFAHEIEALHYQGRYTAVYPIKVNQQADVVKTIVRHGGTRVGLEAGSKPELAAVLGLAPSGSLIVCNGYKDRGYIRRALIGQKLGHSVYIVVEKLSELPIVLEEARALDVAPMIGLRVRLAADSSSTQQNTGGEKAKFGLTTPQVLQAVEMLRDAGRIDSIRMVHFHLGSQVAAVQDIARGLREAARFYVELRRLGAPIDVVDVGGGLGVDYEGTRSRSHCSMNYGLREYARNILRTLRDVCIEAGEPQPNVISESGRALTAHHAVLITSVIDQEVVPTSAIEAPGADAPSVLLELHGLITDIDTRGPIESLHEAAQFLGEAQALYTEGLLSLAQRAWAERAYFAVARLVQPRLDSGIRAERDADEGLSEKLSAKYFCNFSVFQSVPDAWAIEQVFPILPIHRLDEEPALRARLCDLTCDSDGRLDRYVDREGVMPTLAVHPLEEGQPYLIALFMVGAYQEILGDIHNLFGDTNAVNVVLDERAPQGWHLEGAEHGDRTDELLRYVHLVPEELAQSYRKKMASLNLPQAERTALLAELEAGLSGYTYLT